MAASRGFAIWKLVVFILVVMVIMYAAVMDRGWLMGQITHERDGNRKVLGAAASMYAENRADGWFRRLFVDTGVVAGSYKALSSRDHDTQDNGAIAKGNDMAGKVLGWIQERVQVIWIMLYQMFTRISVALMWWPYALLLFIPFIVDALVVRKIKASNFGLTSPHVYSMGARLARLLPWIFLVLLLAPFSLTGIYIPIMLAALAVAAWVSMVQFAKRA